MTKVINRRNALWNCRNPNQGEYRKTLVVCSAGLLRSATIAWYITRNYEDNVRNCGIHDYALIQFDEVLLQWADRIIFVEDHLKREVELDYNLEEKDVVVLNIQDIYEYRNQELVDLVSEELRKYYE